MDPSLQEAIRENLRLTRENNAMLHKMRRNALLGGFFKFVIYAILFAAPIWFYMTYVSNSVDNLLAAVNKLNGTSTAVQNKFAGFESAFANLESHLPAFMQPATTSSSTTQ
jgi:hypothetical protein